MSHKYYLLISSHSQAAALMMIKALFYNCNINNSFAVYAAILTFKMRDRRSWRRQRVLLNFAATLPPTFTGCCIAATLRHCFAKAQFSPYTLKHQANVLKCTHSGNSFWKSSVLGQEKCSLYGGLKRQEKDAFTNLTGLVWRYSQFDL